MHDAELRAAYEQLQAANQALEAQVAECRRLSYLVDASDDAIIGLCLDGSVESWNRGAERLYGYTSAEIVGRPHAVLVPEDELPAYRAAMERLWRGETGPPAKVY